MRIRTFWPSRPILYTWPLIFFALLLSNLSFADTIYLKNNSSVDGTIESETKETVEIHLSYGTMTFYRSEIDRVERSSTKENEAIWQKWGEEQKEIERRKPEEEKKWRERQAELERIRLEEKALKKEQDEYGPKTIRANAKDGQMFMNVLLNGETRVKLVLDSGAGVVMLTRRVAAQLGLDVEKLKKNKTQVADGRWVDMGFTTLKSVKVQNIDVTGTGKDEKSGVEVKNVEACVILDESSGKNKMEDGLLGMAFLKNFKFNADYKSGTVTFERLKEESSPASETK